MELENHLEEYQSKLEKQITSNFIRDRDIIGDEADLLKRVKE